MNVRFKNYYSIFKAGLFLTVLLFFFGSCKKENTILQQFTGKTMGTYYSIKYFDQEANISKATMDSLLIAINQQVSTYIPSSTISQINSNQQAKHSIERTEYSEVFIKNIELTEEIYQLTNGHFDPTVMPLVNFWGFGYTDRELEKKDTTKLDSIRQLIGFDKWKVTLSDQELLLQKPSQASIDFSAIAKGQAIDEIAYFFEKNHITNYFIDIGGESRAKGSKKNQKPWVVGINTPKENSGTQDIKLLLNLNNISIATSGNYRNFYEENGQKYVHTINPFTAFPEQSNLLSASILTKECGRADGIATACMVMGLEKAKKLIQTTADIEGVLIYIDDDNKLNTWHSKGMEGIILQEK